MKMMTLGFFLAMFGMQLNLIESFELTPRFSTFLSEHGSPATQSASSMPTPNPYLQASYDNSAGLTAPALSKTTVVAPPKWVCWPLMFFGAVLVMQGAIRRD